jgi:hypothetical protein
MKKRTILIAIVLLLILPAQSILSQKADFSGQWTLNKEKSVLTDNQLFLSKITIHLKSDSLLTTRVYENGNGEEYPFEENLSLDGKDCKIVIYDMPRTSKATHSDNDGSISISSTTTFTGNGGSEDMTAKENWNVDSEGKVLTLEFTNTMSGNETTGKYYYTKIN